MGKLKSKRVWAWCPGGGKELSWEGDREDSLVYVRCSICRRRYEAQNRGCGLKSVVPKHKRRVISV